MSHVLARLRPTKRLIHDAVEATTWLVDEGNEATARLVVGGLSAVPGLEEPVRAVDGLRRTLTRGVLGSVRAINRAVEVVTDTALDLGAPEPPPAPAMPQCGDQLVSVPGALDQLVGVVNGFVGDHLASSGNGLDLGLRLRHGDHWLSLEPGALRLQVPEPRRRVVLLVHGLSTTELSWSLDAARRLGASGHHYGSLLADEHDLTSLYVRYNTGRSVEENGRAFATALEDLVAHWPVALDEVVLVGHSMGGLIARAATAVAREAGHRWLERLGRMVCLGSPHEGAPLARLGETAAGAMLAVDLPGTRIVGRILDTRSQGVKDLQYRQHHAIGPLLPEVRYLFVSGCLGSRDGAASRAFGDLLVPVQSASGPDGENVQVRHFDGVAHHELQVHAGVYRALADFLS